MLAPEGSHDNIRWSSFNADRLIKFVGRILKLFAGRRSTEEATSLHQMSIALIFKKFTHNSLGAPRRQPDFSRRRININWNLCWIVSNAARNFLFSLSLLRSVSSHVRAALRLIQSLEVYRPPAISEIPKNFHAGTPVRQERSDARIDLTTPAALTSLAEPARNVFALSLNKTYKKYCWCRGVCALGRLAWNITKRVSSGENYLQFSYILLKIIILYYSTRLMGSIRWGGREWRVKRCYI